MTQLSQDADQVWQILERGRLTAEAVRAAAAGEEPPAADLRRLPKYDGLADPVGADELGRRLAERARPLGIDAVLIWEDPEDVVLGQVVGRELGVPVVRSFNADGLVGYSAPLPRGGAVLLLTDLVRDRVTLRAMAALVDQQGARVAGTAVLVNTDVLRQSHAETGQVIALVDAEA